MEEQIEQLFQWIDQTATIIEQEENVPYLEAVIAASQLLFDREMPDDLEPSYDKSLKDQLGKVHLKDFEMEVRRKAMQLAILKGMKGATQQHHYITPDTVGMFMGYLVQKFMQGEKSYRMFDPACGTSNLLLAVLNQQKGTEIAAFGSEVDATLMRLAFNNTNLQERHVEYFHQDSLKPILLEPVDVVISDLPVGYYPDDETASGYDLKAEEDHSFAHHLFIEQSLKYTKEAGYLFLTVPSFLFESEQKEQLQSFLKENAHIVGLLELPESMFKNKQHQKSIFILQKKGTETKDPKKVMLAELPSFKDAHAMNGMLEQINEWFKNDR
ncbi:SAM-dependent methyltransferase [Halalkalibacillus sediminis]|uniref:SAM-dependent methyltransferase n=1 Tax=Halalkalibacillus sediminis TaxID=2018042 RepID=A0A2I0QY76_9BACI|nr:class I SAM-dependent methyltransferase [Halalkalibacillus sediminis]PKR79287.1 SAM-dependent methyltransferase [Halalkalibacillus sediminis]